MKRKWMWALAALPLVLGLVVAKRLADKRPRLIARGLDISGVTISPDGKRIIVRGDKGVKSQVIHLDNGPQFSIPGDANSHFFFSPDATKIYQLNTEWEKPETKQHVAVFHKELEVRDAYSGRLKGQFRFANDANLYGVTWQSDELIAESPRQTWHFDLGTLRVRNIQKQNRTQAHADLCPDGRTLYWLTSGKMHALSNAWEVADLNTGKILRNGAKFGETIIQFSADGHTALWFRYDGKGYEVVARDTRTGIEKWRLRGPQSPAIALSPDESALYEARPNGELWKWPR